MRVSLANPKSLTLKAGFLQTSNRRQTSDSLVFCFSSSPGPTADNFFADFGDGHRRCEQFLLRSKWMIRSVGRSGISHGPLQPRDPSLVAGKAQSMMEWDIEICGSTPIEWPRVRVKSQNLSQSGRQGQDEGKEYNIRGESRSTSCFCLFIFLAPPCFSWLKFPLNRAVALPSLFQLESLEHCSISILLYYTPSLVFCCLGLRRSC